MSLKTLLAVALAVSTPAFAAENINLGANGKAAVAMQEAHGEYVLQIKLPSGKVQKINDEFVPFDFEGQAAAIAIFDLDHDGSEDIVVRAMIPPQSGGLYVYRYSAKEKKFVALQTGDEADDTYLPVDAVAPVRVERDGRVLARIIVRDENGERTEDREFKFKGGKFKRSR